MNMSDERKNREQKRDDTIGAQDNLDSTQVNSQARQKEEDGDTYGRDAS